jgi:hypothetical protein
MPKGSARWLDERRDRIDPADRDRIDHPMRVLDSKRPATIEAIAGTDAAQLMTDDELGRFEQVQAGIAAAGHRRRGRTEAGPWSRL